MKKLKQEDTHLSKVTYLESKKTTDWQLQVVQLQSQFLC